MTLVNYVCSSAPEVVARVGTIPTHITFADLSIEHAKYMAFCTHTRSDAPGVWELAFAQDESVVLPVDVERRAVYLVRQLRPALYFAGNEPGARGPFLIPGMEIHVGKKKCDAPDQHRTAVQEFKANVPTETMLTIECPMDSVRRGESPALTALRELRDDVGIEAEACDLMQYGAAWPSPGMFGQRLHLHLVRVDGYSMGKPTGNGDEAFELLRIPFEDAWQMCDTGEITSLATVALLQRLQLLDARGPLTHEFPSRPHDHPAARQRRRKR